MTPKVDGSDAVGQVPSPPTERVIAKHLKAIGFGHLVDQKMGPALKTILYDHGQGRYVALAQD